MGLMSFIKEAGEKLFGSNNPEKAAAEAATAADPVAAQEKLAAANAGAAAAIEKYIGAQGLNVDGLQVAFDGTTCQATVSGCAPDQATKEKVLLCCGNVAGVTAVNDMLTVTAPADESRYHTVVRGDTLSGIAKAEYGNANAYMKIFEANKPMLSHPDKIYPGQVLRLLLDRLVGLGGPFDRLVGFGLAVVTAALVFLLLPLRLSKRLVVLHQPCDGFTAVGHALAQLLARRVECRCVQRGQCVVVEDEKSIGVPGGSVLRYSITSEAVCPLAARPSDRWAMAGAVRTSPRTQTR